MAAGHLDQNPCVNNSSATADLMGGWKNPFVNDLLTLIIADDSLTFDAVRK